MISSQSSLPSFVSASFDVHDVIITTTIVKWLFVEVYCFDKVLIGGELHR